MKLMSNELFKAVRFALYAGATAAVGLSAGTVFAQDTTQDSSSQKLETITVTGSNIRRVDIETSNPVITIDKTAIMKSGKATVGDLVQQLPTIAGNANNPNVNNGGGTGGSFISLRGLGSNRTLVLVNGKRTISSDVNMIPASAIERIEVLTDGASAVYGSDAIAGVVNFILRSDYQGAELTTGYGISDKDDGVRKNFSLTFGQTSDKGSVVGGIDYNKTDAISASHRDFSTFALTYNPDTGAVTPGGSNSSPAGRISAPQFKTACPGGRGVADPTAPGGNGIPAGYRCFVNSDKYNYAAINLITTPQERTNFFLMGNYKLTDSVEAYASVVHNKTNSRAELAALPVNLAAAGLVFEAGNPYNPFGVDIGNINSAANNVSTRLTGLGPRIVSNSQDNDQAVVGIKGNILDSSWQFDLWANYGHNSYRTENINYFNAAAAQVQLSAACDPIVAGQPVGASSCLDLFNQSTNPVAQQVLAGDRLNVFSNGYSRETQIGLDVNGTLFDLPAGSVSLAAGANYRRFTTVNDADTVAITPPGTSNCPAGSPSLCTSPFSGGFNVKEAYVEMYVPILKDLPFIHSLSATLGDRYSKYSSFGSTNNWKAALEYRPIEDLLLRGTVSTVFRAPNTTELFTALLSSYDPYVSPGTDSLGRNYESLNGDQMQVLFSGAAIAGNPIKPEKGKSFDFGAVYDPGWLPGLTVSADLWRIYLNDLIVRPDGQTIADFCFNDPSSTYCNFINFGANGILSESGVSYVNLGRLDTKGVDFSASYKLPETAFGNFNVGLQTTYLSQYDNTIPGTGVRHVAGDYDSQYGSFSRWRALGTIGWQMSDFSAQWTQRYIGSLNGPFYRTPTIVYHNLAFGYNIAPINTRFDIGVDNVTNKQAPLYYNAVTNANIDINTYDPIGRFYWARATVKF